jgi:hypothetical protein
MQIVHYIEESSSSSAKLFNAAHVYSSLNRKMIPPVDSQGNAQVFGLNVKAYSASANTITLETASNSYVTKQSIKAWFKVWKSKFADDGVSMKDLGPYGRVFKPRLKASETLLGSGGEAGRGEWNYSDVVQTAPITGGSTLTGTEVTDQFTLSICGSTTEDTSGDGRRFANVGMIESWLGSRKSIAGAEAGTDVSENLVFDEDNPLVLSRGGSLHSEMLLDEVRDLQKDEPPYDGQDFDGTYVQAKMKCSGDLMAECDILAPCGLVEVTTAGACILIFTLTGIGEM